MLAPSAAAHPTSGLEPGSVPGRIPRGLLVRDEPKGDPSRLLAKPLSARRAEDLGAKPRAGRSTDDFGGSDAIAARTEAPSERRRGRPIENWGCRDLLARRGSRRVAQPVTLVGFATSRLAIVRRHELQRRRDALGVLVAHARDGGVGETGEADHDRQGTHGQRQAQGSPK